MTNATYDRIIASVQEPLDHFVKTGFWKPNTHWKAEDVGGNQVRKACRELARSMKRPFIQCYDRSSMGEWVQTNAAGQPYMSKWMDYKTPVWSFGYFEAPIQKRLLPLVAPLMLGSVKQGRYRSATAHKVSDNSLETVWRFHIYDQEIWNGYYSFVLDDPDCRRARNFTS
jgi:hypothetical protein